MYKILSIFTIIIVMFFNTCALTIVPFVHSFDPKDNNKKTFQYCIENKTEDSLAFEITVFRRKLDKKGHDILEKDKDSFKLIPSQIIIPPHKQQSIKVKWKGNDEFYKNPNKEQAFRVVMSQFPVNLNKKKDKRQASIQVVYEIRCSLYATPKDAKPDLKVAYENAKIIALKNDGNRRAELRKSTLVIRNKKVTDLVKPEEIETVIMPGDIREYNKREISTVQAKKSAER